MKQVKNKSIIIRSSHLPTVVIQGDFSYHQDTDKSCGEQEWKHENSKSMFKLWELIPADKVIVDRIEADKISLIGIFTRVRLQAENSYITALPSFVFYGRIKSAEPIQSDETKKLNFKLFAPSGKILFEADIPELRFDKGQDSSVFLVRGGLLPFQEEGYYAVEVSLDGTLLERREKVILAEKIN